jgi:hypothetical protein
LNEERTEILESKSNFFGLEYEKEIANIIITPPQLCQRIWRNKLGRQSENLYRI